LAGSAGNSGSTDGTNSSARFYHPVSLAVDNAGNIFVSDSWNSLIRKITPSGVVTTVAGPIGNNIQGIAVDNSGNLYVADMMDSVILKIATNGIVSTFAGQSGSNGSVDATGSAARFYFPIGVATDTNGNVYVADSVNETIRKITPSAAVTTLAGSPRSYGYADGTGSAALFHNPCGLCVDTSNNIYVADNANQVVRKVTQTGVVTTLAGYPGSSGAADGSGNAARFYSLNGVAADSAGNIYVADTSNQAIRKITPNGVVTTLAGQSGNSGSADGIGSVARFYQPGAVAVNPAGNLFVADSMNYTIRATQPLATKVNQSIAFPTIPEHSASDAPFTITATASSGLPVYFNVISGPAVSSNNVVTLLGGGTVTVVAWQPGDGNYNAAPTVQQSFIVNKVPQTITFGILSQQKVGDAPFALNATTDSGLPVSFSASGSATLSGNILILTGWGTVTVTASQAGNNTYAAATNVIQSFFVVPPNNTLVSPQRLPNGGFQMGLYGLTSSNYTIKSSTNLISWQTFTNFTGSNALFYFNDPAATNFKQRFYRVTP
jgi:sugar lactone lactonase YvrE